jgi:hypothetical protein
MKIQNLSILVAVAAVLVAVAAYTQKNRTITAPARAGQKVLPGLAVNDVARVEIADAGATAVVSRASGEWAVEQKRGYPADYERVHRALVALWKLQIGQEQQATPAQFAAMKLTPEAGTRVRLCGAGGETLAELVLGKTRTRMPSESDMNAMMMGGWAEGRYVARGGAGSALLVQDALSDLVTDAAQWLDTKLVEVAAAGVQEVRVSRPGAPELVFRAEGESMALEGLAADEEMNPDRNFSLRSALSALRFKDLAAEGLDDARLGFTNAAVCQVTTASNEVYTVRLGGSPEGLDDRYARVAAELLPPLPEPPPDPAAATNAAVAQAQADAAAARARARAESEARVAGLNARQGRWTFVIAKYDADNLLPERSAVVKKKEPPAPAATNAPPAAPTP